MTSANPLSPAQQALHHLALWLKRQGYDFITVTPEAHRRLRLRHGDHLGTSLHDVFGWNMDFPPDLLPPEVLGMMREAGTLETIAPGRTRSRIRFASMVFWRRVEDGYRMSETGWGTNDAIASFDLHAELLRVLAHRAGEGQASHSDHCRIEGRTVNEWLSKPDGVPAFVDALQRGRWLVRDTDPAESRFWRLLQGETPHMFGVFNDYELQVIHDWIRGEAASDGMKCERGPAGATSAARRPVRSFRQSQRLALARGTGNPSLLSSDASPRFDPDLDALRQALNDGDDPVRQGTLLRQLLGPAFHWGMAGLEATRHVSSLMRAVA